MPIEHPAVDQVGHRQRLFEHEPDRQVQVVLADPFVSQRSVDPPRRGVDEHWDVQVDGGRPERIEALVVESDPEIGPYVRCDQSEIADRPAELGDGRVHVLHRQLRCTDETVGVAGDQGREFVVVPPTELGRNLRLDVVEVRDRVG